MKYVNPKEVVIFTTTTIHNYISDQAMDQLDSSILMSLKTSSWKEPPLAPYLTPPNTIVGQPAAGKGGREGLIVSQ